MTLDTTEHVKATASPSQPRDGGSKTGGPEDEAFWEADR